MRTLIIAAFPIVTMLADPAIAANVQNRPHDQEHAAVAARTQTGSELDVVPSRGLIGMPVTYRHQTHVIGTVQDVATDDDGRVALTLKFRNRDRPMALGLSDFERRGDRIVLMLSADELAQLQQYGQ